MSLAAANPALPRYDGPAAWKGAEIKDDPSWARAFSPAELAELEAAVAETKARGLAIVDIDEAAFPLPTLGPALKAIREELIRGRGFILLRSLSIEGRDMDAVARLYWGIGRHIGRPVSQNAKGHLLGHVRDMGLHSSDPNVRVYQTTERQFFHADSCDIVGLLCLRPARRGGESRIVSSVTLYNEIVRRRPDLAALLAEPQAVDRRGEVPRGKPPYYMVPVFNHHDGMLTTYYVRRYIVSCQRFPEVPRLTPGHHEAFDLLDLLADDPELRLDMEFRPGDIQLLHNPTILHDRGAFEDWPETERKRHLLRLWLCPPDGRPLPRAFEDRWGSIEIGNRGGILAADTRLNVPLEAV